MICRRCGKKLPDDSVFCQYCGTKVETINESNANEWNNYSYIDKKPKKQGLILFFILIIGVMLIGGGVLLATTIEGWNGAGTAEKELPKVENNATKTPEIENNKVTYLWYDTDGKLLFEERIKRGKQHSEYALPSDSKKWDYICWQEGEAENTFIAQRTLQKDYFIGNVFQIVIKDLNGDPVGTGSAFVFNRSGWFITNAHVVEDAYYAEAIFNIPNEEVGESYTYLDINEGTFYHLDKDIYIGKISGYTKILSYYNEIPLCMEYSIGDKTFSVGYPNSSAEQMINEGYIAENWSDLYEKLYSGNSYICSTSYIAPGSSGGILVNENLEVLGITTLGWNDKDGEFISGAAISSFNFANLLESEWTKEVTSLVDRFHSSEKTFIGCYNAAKLEAQLGGAEEITYDDGTVGYVYELNDDNESNEEEKYVGSYTFAIGSDGWIEFTAEHFWDVGDRRTHTIYGIYDHKNEFENFKYQFLYEWNDGDYYEVTCDDINYSTNIDLTLNKYVVDWNECEPSKDNIDYAKESFNSLYETLTKIMDNYK